MAGQKKVLIVEDDELSRMMMTEMVGMLGYPVEEAANGAEALSKATATDIALILLDNHLPDGTGSEILQRLRQQEASLAMDGRKIVAVTGDVLDEDRRRLLQDGFDEHMGKPVMLPDLEALLGKYAA